MDNAETPNENWLTRALQVLKGKGVIKSNKDVADKTGYSEGSISNMAAGRVPLSDKFKRKFEESFGEYLKEYPLDNEGIEFTLELSKKYTVVLEEQVQLQRDYIKVLKEKLEQKGKK